MSGVDFGTCVLLQLKLLDTIQSRRIQPAFACAWKLWTTLIEAGANWLRFTTGKWPPPPSLSISTTSSHFIFRSETLFFAAAAERETGIARVHHFPYPAAAALSTKKSRGSFKKDDGDGYLRLIRYIVLHARGRHHHYSQNQPRPKIRYCCPPFWKPIKIKIAVLFPPPKMANNATAAAFFGLSHSMLWCVRRRQFGEKRKTSSRFIEATKTRLHESRSMYTSSTSSVWASF